jgi:hypothetical protein
MATHTYKNGGARLRRPYSDLEGQEEKSIQYQKTEKTIQNKKQGKASVLYIGIILFAVLRFISRYMRAPRTYISCDQDQPLVRIQHDYLGPQDYQDLVQCTLQHPKLHVKSSLNAGAFSKAKGFVVKFNTKGVSKFLQHPLYGDCFGSLFERMRLPDTNAYVFNALVCEPFSLTEEEISQGEYTRVRESTVVGIHLDQTVAMQGTNPHDFLAHQVNVMYVDVPEDMVGGTLELWRYDGWRSGSIRHPHESVTPSNNTMVAFRGDSYHRVKAYHSVATNVRLSLVLEQYKIGDDRHVADTLEWIEESKED